jgi:SHS2 domain-containing protein
MPYRYLDEIATADAAFEAWGETIEAMFSAAADATLNVMVSELDTIAPIEHRTLEVAAEELDMLLFQLLQEIIFYKDAEQLLLRVGGIRIEEKDGRLLLTAEASGETLQPEKHDLIVDVKAVTLHRFKVEETARGWEAFVILDI